jgi:hypothetical protein
MSSPRKIRLASIRWYSPTDTPEERRAIMKLDLLIVPFAMLAYWIKYVDQGNLSKPLLNPYKPRR